MTITNINVDFTGKSKEEIAKEIEDIKKQLAKAKSELKKDEPKTPREVKKTELSVVKDLLTKEEKTEDEARIAKAVEEAMVHAHDLEIYRMKVERGEAKAKGKKKAEA